MEKPADLTGVKVATVRFAKSCFSAVLLAIVLPSISFLKVVVIKELFV